MHHPSRPLAGVVLSASALLLLAIPAVAGGSTTTTASTSTTSTSTTSTTAPGDGATPPAKPKPTVPPPSTTSTTQPPPPPPPAPEAPPDPNAVPPEVQAMIDAYPRTPGHRTDDLLEALAPLADLHLQPEQHAPAFGRFPVAGRASYIDDWLFPRHVPDFHVHQGTDVFADRGTPVLSPTAGTVRVSDGAVGGLSVKVVQPDGTYWYLAHLSAVADGLHDGQQVVAGQVVGAVGDSGNAKGGAPHTHVEVHPHGGDPVDPKPYLDQYLAEAERDAPAKVDALVRWYGPWTRPLRLDPLPDDLK